MRNYENNSLKTEVRTEDRELENKTEHARAR